MKKKIFVIAVGVATIISSHAFAGSYCEGYKSAYKTACKAAKGYTCPTPPCPPTPPRKPGEPMDAYERGFLHGVLAGSQA